MKKALVNTVQLPIIVVPFLLAIIIFIFKTAMILSDNMMIAMDDMDKWSKK